MSQLVGGGIKNNQNEIDTWKIPVAFFFLAFYKKDFEKFPNFIP